MDFLLGDARRNEYRCLELRRPKIAGPTLQMGYNRAPTRCHSRHLKATTLPDMQSRNIAKLASISGWTD